MTSRDRIVETEDSTIVTVAINGDLERREFDA